MASSVLQTALYVFGACSVGILIGWSIQAVTSRRRANRIASATESKLLNIAGQRDQLGRKYSKARSSIEKLHAENARRKKELRALLRKSKTLAGNVVTLRAEREKTKVKLTTIQNALASMRQQTTTLQSEFVKTREFYKRELLKSAERRKKLEQEVQEARVEQEKFARQVESSVLEHGSPENMITAAQLRLGQLEVLERNVQKLETENAELRNEAIQARQQVEARERDLREMDELKLHNRQLVQCVEALESSRKAHEADAERYREQADESEKESDTLRLKLEDLEKNFADIEEQQNNALEDVRNETVIPILRNQG